MFIRGPFRLAFTGTDELGGANGDGKKSEEGKKPTADMTLEERVAFEEGAKRKVQDRLKAFNGKTPEDVLKLEKEIEELRKANLSASDKAIEDAKAVVQSEWQTKLGLERVNYAFEKALNGRIPDTSALLSLDRSAFADGDKADMQKITEWVEEHSTATSEKKKDVDLGQGRGRGGDGPAKGVAAGADLFNQSRKKSS